MNKPSYFGKSLLLALSQQDMTQVELSNLSDLRQTTISALISKPKRPDVQTLNSLCTCWKNPQTGINILIGHLRDEIGRAGHDPENDISMVPKNHPAAKTKIEHDLETIKNHLHDDGVSELLHDLAIILGRSNTTAKLRYQVPEPHTAQLVAEKPT